MLRRFLCLATVLLAALAASACDSDSKSKDKNSQTAPTDPNPPMVKKGKSG